MQNLNERIRNDCWLSLLTTANGASSLWLSAFLMPQIPQGTTSTSNKEVQQGAPQWKSLLLSSPGAVAGHWGCSCCLTLPHCQPLVETGCKSGWMDGLICFGSLHLPPNWFWTKTCWPVWTSEQRHYSQNYSSLHSLTTIPQVFETHKLLSNSAYIKMTELASPKQGGAYI